MIILNATNFIKFGAVGAEEDDLSFPMYLAYSVVPELKLPLQTSARSGQVFLKGSPSPLQHFIFLCFPYAHCAFTVVCFITSVCLFVFLLPHIWTSWDATRCIFQETRHSPVLVEVVRAIFRKPDDVWGAGRSKCLHSSRCLALCFFFSSFLLQRRR